MLQEKLVPKEEHIDGFLIQLKLLSFVRDPNKEVSEPPAGVSGGLVAGAVGQRRESKLGAVASQLAERPIRMQASQREFRMVGSFVRLRSIME